ncbi:D(1B) dopamine receptor [Scyliorhinus canicula]|uniref:D(1B) dopamine receptor n=1 Tax=Scyliorhinus canicula TaxID=7830 RepID=UPI0018F52371|nr:D(1B) dopamine receptor [Scyliorhinus canicula]XP_038647997.1 D(1B) dopamine receptor [Scyliorhinus canicula]
MPNRTLSEGAASARRELLTRVLTGFFLSLLILFTLLGNALVCAAVFRFRHLRGKVTNIFIVSLALSDLLVAILVMPWKAVAEVAAYWPFGPFCKVWVAFDIMCSTASILNLCVISVDRYWAIGSPFRYERKMTRRLALLMIGVTWALSILISFIPVQLDWHSSEPEEGAQGSSSGTNCDSSLNRTYAISSSLISFYIPVAIMLVTYTRIYRIAQIQIRRIASLERAAEHAQTCHRNPLDCQQHSTLKSSFKKETKVLKTLSIIMGVFVCCWLPFFILNCLVPFCDRSSPAAASSLPCVSETTFDIFVWFGWANSTLNPVVYAFNADFRKAFSSLLGCHNVCPGNQVETVNISNELVSYNQDTVLHKEMVTAYVNMIPNAVGGCLDSNQLFDRMSQISPSHELATDSLDEVDGDAALSVDKITAFTSNGLH